jgi:hypothetical protein
VSQPKLMGQSEPAGAKSLGQSQLLELQPKHDLSAEPQLSLHHGHPNLAASRASDGSLALAKRCHERGGGRFKLLLKVELQDIVHQLVHAYQ